jgi:hypothetical protein
MKLYDDNNNIIINYYIIYAFYLLKIKSNYSYNIYK